MAIRYFILSVLTSVSFYANSQCLSSTCPPTMSEYSSSATCGTVVNYTSPVFSSSCSSIAQDTFFFTGGVQTFTVPNGVSQVTIEVWGAQGGANWVNNVNFGGYNKADFPVTSGSVLEVYVGGQATSTVGGYNGGGNGEGAGKGGGGASDVRMNGSTLNDRIITAGGGGGAGYWSSLHVVGGVGGGVNGGDGYRNTTADPGGLGATPMGPGASGTCVSFNNPANAGSFGIGGSPSGCGCEGYGGGGGYYGGAASGNCRGGGGGSGYISLSGTNTATADGIRVGDGMVVLSYQIEQQITVTQIAGLASGATFPVGITTNTFQATTQEGDTLECTFLVEVIDTIPPVIPPLLPVTLYTDSGSCSSTAVIPNLPATDNCGIATIMSDAPTTYPIGTTIVHWVVIDDHMNSAIAQQEVIVLDTIAPVFEGPIISSQICEGAAAVFGTPNATDNCNVTVTQISGPSSGSFLPPGVYGIAFVATDPSNNTDTLGFSITVLQNPAITLDIQTPSDPVCVYNAPFLLSGVDPTGGNWSGTGVQNDTFDPSVSGTGSIQITYSYTDFQGCSSIAVDTIEVDECLSVMDQSATTFALFPNPTNGNVAIQVAENGQILVEDMQGKLVAKHLLAAGESTLDLHYLSGGMYALTFIGNSGKVTVSRLVIQH